MQVASTSNVAEDENAYTFTVMSGDIGAIYTCEADNGVTDGNMRHVGSITLTAT